MRKWIWKQIKGILFALPLMLLTFGLYRGYLVPHRMETGIQGTEPAALLIAIIIVNVLLHEALHGIGWLLFGKYLAGRLLPLWTMGTAGIIGLFLWPGKCSFVSVEFIFYLSGMDIAEAFSILKIRSKAFPDCL